MAQDAIQVTVITDGDAKEVRFLLAEQPPDANDAAQVQIRKGGRGIAIRIRDASDWTVFANAVGAA